MRRFLFGFALVLVAAFGLAGCAHTGSGGYARWTEGTLGSHQLSTHWYLAAKVTSMHDDSATIEIGVGGQLIGYTIDVQPGTSNPAGGVSAVGNAVRENGTHNTERDPMGTFSTLTMTVRVPSPANAVRILLTPSNSGGSPRLSMTLAATTSTTGRASELGMVDGTGTCPAGCMQVSGTCEGCPNGGKLGPVCCKGDESELNCVTCKLTCPGGECK